MVRRQGVIRANEVYTLPEFQARVGFGQHAMRAAREAGLPVRYSGSKGFVVGDEALKYFSQAPRVHAGAETSAVLSNGGGQ